MSLKVTCPKCQTTSDVPQEKVGGEFPCPQCGKVMRVKSPAPPTAAETPVVAAVTSAQPSVPPHRTKESSEDIYRAPAKHETKPEQPIVGVLAKKSEHRQTQRLPSLLDPLLQTHSPTDPNIIFTAIVGLILAFVTYWGVLNPLGKTYVGQLFVARGWVPYAITFLTFWSITILVLKWQKLLEQRRCLTFDLLPTDTSHDIDLSNAADFRKHIHRLPLNTGRDFLVRRVMLALNQFEARGNVQDVGAILTAQGEIDGARVNSSYGMLHVLIWAIPILGFIGTVIGISDAVAGFTKSLKTAQEMEAIKDSLTLVTAGLAVAFDTTLVALVMSMVIMFPANSLQKAEEDLLSSVDQYCTEHLLPRLNDRRATSAEDQRQKQLIEHIDQVGKKLAHDLSDLVKSLQGSIQGSITTKSGTGDSQAAALSAQLTLHAEPHADGANQSHREVSSYLAMIEDLKNRLVALSSPAESHLPPTPRV